MKGCRRLHPFSVITYHLGLFFLSPFSLAPRAKRMGTLEREANQRVKYRREPMCHLGAHTPCHTRPAGLLAGPGRLQHSCGVVFSPWSTHTNAFQRKTVFVPTTLFEGTFWSLLPHSCGAVTRSGSCDHLWATVIAANQSSRIKRAWMEVRSQKGSRRF